MSLPTSTAEFAEVAKPIFANHCSVATVAAAEGSWAPSLWQRLETAGLTQIGQGDVFGGVGEAAGVIELAGRYAAPVPLPETALLAAWMLNAAKIEVPPGPLAVIGDVGDPVAWASVSQHMAVLGDGVVTLHAAAACEIEHGLNLAGEPRDRVAPRGRPVATGECSITPDELLVRSALVRSIQMVGALGRILDMTVAYATERQQFGQPIARFQAVQQKIALLAAEVAAARAAGAVAVSAVASADPAAWRSVAAAKVRCGQAATTGTQLAHQVHGAIGYTHEHPLRLFTTRLWSWRDEFGSERSWAERLGRHLLARSGGGAVWEAIADE